MGTVATIDLPGHDPNDNGIGSMRHKEAVAIAKIFTERWYEGREEELE